MHIGYDYNSGHVYEGANLQEFAVVPAPLLTQARPVESTADLSELPGGIHGMVQPRVTRRRAERRVPWPILAPHFSAEACA